MNILWHIYSLTNCRHKKQKFKLYVFERFFSVQNEDFIFMEAVLATSVGYVEASVAGMDLQQNGLIGKYSILV